MADRGIPLNPPPNNGNQPGVQEGAADVPLGMVPSTWAVGQAMDNRTAEIKVLLRITCPIGSFTFILEPDVALSHAEHLKNKASASKAGLML